MLHQYLQTIILVGMQREYCIVATCQSVFDWGYQVIIPENCKTIFDNDYLSEQEFSEYYEKAIWNHLFAEVC